MKYEIKAQWLEALRSGEYRQGKGCLRSDEGFCCLGVLTDLAVKAGVGVWHSRPRGFGYSFFVEDSGELESGLLPCEVREWAGIKNGSPSYEAEGGRHIWLTELNDNGTSFNEIADVIEYYA